MILKNNCVGAQSIALCKVWGLKSDNNNCTTSRTSDAPVYTHAWPYVAETFSELGCKNWDWSVWECKKRSLGAGRWDALVQIVLLGVCPRKSGCPTECLERCSSALWVPLSGVCKKCPESVPRVSPECPGGDAPPWTLVGHPDYWGRSVPCPVWLDNGNKRPLIMYLVYYVWKPKEDFKLPGEGGDHLHCTADSSPGHIRRRRSSWGILSSVDYMKLMQSTAHQEIILGMPLLEGSDITYKSTGGVIFGVIALNSCNEALPHWPLYEIILGEFFTYWWGGVFSLCSDVIIVLHISLSHLLDNLCSLVSEHPIPQTAPNGLALGNYVMVPNLKKQSQSHSIGIHLTWYGIKFTVLSVHTVGGVKSRCMHSNITFKLLCQGSKRVSK